MAAKFGVGARIRELRQHPPVQLEFLAPGSVDGQRMAQSQHIGIGVLIGPPTPTGEQGQTALDLRSGHREVDIHHRTQRRPPIVGGRQRNTPQQNDVDARGGDLRQHRAQIHEQRLDPDPIHPIGTLEPIHQRIGAGPALQILIEQRQQPGDLGVEGLRFVQAVAPGRERRNRFMPFAECRGQHQTLLGARPESRVGVHHRPRIA